MDEALAKLEREVAQDPSDEGRLRALAAAKQRVGWTYAGRGFEHWVEQLHVQDDDARDHRTDWAFRSFGIAAVPALLEAMGSGAAFPAYCALSMLGKDAVLAATPGLRRLVATGEGDARVDALLLLESNASFEDMFDVFEREITATDEEARERALYRVARHASRPLEHDELQVAVAAAEALKAFGPSASSATESLERALASNDRDLSWAARLALDAVRKS